MTNEKNPEEVGADTRQLLMAIASVAIIMNLWVFLTTLHF